MSHVPVSVCDVGAMLGEGPAWISGALWFVDIKASRLHRFDPETATLKSWAAPAQIGWILPADGGGMVAGLQDGLYRFDPVTGQFDLICQVEADRPQSRLNDAATDCHGRIWFGSMDDAESAPTGLYYRFERGRVTPTGLPPTAITNGPALSPDGRWLYHVDTRGGLIHRCTVSTKGELGPSRLFVSIPPTIGFPDGPTVDAEGCVWVGLYASWQAHRYSPAGELLRTIDFPVANITKLAFGGEDLRTVYATTARLHLKPAELDSQKLAGNLFSFRSDVPGVEITPARLS